jgi:transcriptional regulator with XRE-family HTH domain
VKRARVTYRFSSELAERLRLIRKQAGLTQAQLTTLMGREERGTQY